MGTRLVATGLDQNGAGTIIKDTIVEDTVLEDGSKIALLWAYEDEVTRHNANYLDQAEAFTRLSDAGKGPIRTLWGVTELPPGGRIDLHATPTVDLLVGLEGEVVCRLETGASVVLRAGETMIQRGQLHIWENEGSVPCRWMFVALADERHDPVTEGASG